MSKNMVKDNKLYLVGVKCSLDELAQKVSIVNEFELAYFGFWDSIVLIEYNQDTKNYLVKEDFSSKPHYFSTHSEQILFKYMDDNEINFVGDNNPLGAIFRSYAAAYLEVVRWAADVARCRNFMFSLIED